MALALVLSRANIGIEAPLVNVEVHLSNGLPGFSIVGLPETVVKESKERVRSAILNSRFDFPARRITVNLAPAELPKAGGRFDLAIALGILVASSQIKAKALQHYEFMAELALSGGLRRVKGVLPGLLACHKDQRSPVVATANEADAALLSQQGVLLADHLLDVCAFLESKGNSEGKRKGAGKGKSDGEGKAGGEVKGEVKGDVRGDVRGKAKGETKGNGELRSAQPLPEQHCASGTDLAQVKGQHQAKRALLIAAAGGHNLLFKGPPGTGKTMLASCLPTILPPLSHSQRLDVAALHSISDKTETIQHSEQPPFRSPHHTASAVAMVGGGSNLNPGEISMAHHGVLFLDELPEFSPKVLEVMREPMESGQILISRAAYQVRLPASFQFLAAMNPCPCGYYGDSDKACVCAIDKVHKYQQRVSGPLLDRIDLHVQVPRLSASEQQALMTAPSVSGPDSQQSRTQAMAARARQASRQTGLNAGLTQEQIHAHCRLEDSEQALLNEAAKKLSFSLRAYFRILKVARTIADLADSEQIKRPHLLEAISYR